MGCFNSKSTDESNIRAKYEDNKNDHLNNNNTVLEAEEESMYEYEEEESEIDDSYLNDPDYYNNKARLK